MSLKELVEKRNALRKDIIADEQKTGRVNLMLRADREVLTRDVALEIRNLYDTGKLGASRLRALIEEYNEIGTRSKTGDWATDRGNYNQYMRCECAMTEEVERMYKTGELDGQSS